MAAALLFQPPLELEGLGQAVVPKWFGVLVPEGVSSFDNIHLFFHPTLAQRLVYMDRVS
jgi:hypothetical protein